MIDLTEDDEVEVERKESKPVETKPGLPSKDDSGMRSWRLCHSLSQMSSRTLWLVYSCTFNREQNLIFSTPCYYNFISYTVLKLTYLPPPPPPRKETEQSKTKQTKNNVELLAKYREHWMVEGGGVSSLIKSVVKTWVVFYTDRALQTWCVN